MACFLVLIAVRTVGFGLAGFVWLIGCFCRFDILLVRVLGGGGIWIWDFGLFLVVCWGWFVFSGALQYTFPG